MSRRNRTSLPGYPSQRSAASNTHSQTPHISYLVTVGCLLKRYGGRIPEGTLADQVQRERDPLAARIYRSLLRRVETLSDDELKRVVQFLQADLRRNGLHSNPEALSALRQRIIPKPTTAGDEIEALCYAMVALAAYGSALVPNDPLTGLHDHYPWIPSVI